MIRVLALFSVLLLAGCATTGNDAAPYAVADIGPVSLSLADLPDTPSRVESAFYSAFATEAPRRGVPFAPGTSGTIIVRGYLSVAGSASGTLLIYVFDFEDKDGNRLIRIGGQASSQTATTDPWEAVDNALIGGVVTRVLDDFRRWLDDNRVSA